MSTSRKREILVRPTGTSVDQFQRDVKLRLAELKTEMDAIGILVGASPLVGPRRILRFVPGANVTITVSDDQANEEIRAEIASSGGGGGVSDGDKGDITVSGGGTNWQIDAGAVGTAEIANLAVDSSKLANGAVDTAKVADNAVTYAKLQNVAENRLLGRDSGAGAGDAQELQLGLGVELSGVGSLQVAENGVKNSMLNDMDESRIKGRAAGAGTGDPTDLTPAQVITLLGLVVARGKYAPGSFTLATGEYGYMVKQLQLVSSDRATLEGTARLVVEN